MLLLYHIFYRFSTFRLTFSVVSNRPLCYHAPRAEIIGGLLEKADSADEVNLDSETGVEYNYDRGEQNVREKTLRDGSGRVWRENNNFESGTGEVQKTDVGSFGEDQTAYARKEFTAGRSQSVRDSIGRGIRLTSEQIEILKLTAIKNNDGNPKEEVAQGVAQGTALCAVRSNPLQAGQRIFRPQYSKRQPVR